MQILSEFLKRQAESVRGMNVHVIGDSVLDEDYQVSASRISPECANIIVLESENQLPFRGFPGGAANVCSQLKNFVAIPRLFSLLDNEAYCVFKSMGIEFWGQLHLPNGSRIPRKKRFYDADFQVGCRWDVEKRGYGLDNIHYYRSKLMELWSAFQAEPDVVVYSDYDKGLFSDCGYLNVPQDVPTIVDPKAKPISKWRGCTIFKPNAKEATELSGLTDWKAQCDYFQRELGCKAVIITQAGSGVVGKIDDYFEYKLTKKIDPFQVIGAGDCFIAMLALAIAYKFTIYEAVSIAFEISQIYVQQPHRAFIGPWHLGVKDMCPKLLKKRDFKLVFTNGCFDIIHPGHLETLKYAKSKGDKLLVGMNGDESIRQLKGSGRPVNTLKDRMEVLKAIENVDFVVSFEETEPGLLIEKIKPDYLVKGSDWEDKDISGAELVQKVYFAPMIKEKSTTDLIERIRSYGRER